MSAAWLAALLAASAWGGDMPAAGAMKPYRLPSRQQWRMENGVRVVLVEDHRFPLVTVRLAAPVGAAAFEPQDAGLAEAMADLLTDGTAQRGSKQVSDAAEEYGGAIAASAGPDSVTLESYCLSDAAERMFSLMAEVAVTPSFPQAEVTLRRKNMLEELNVSRGEPDFLASVAFFKKLYAGHPYAVTAPTEASIARIDRRRLVAAHRSLFTPKNAVLVVAGDITRSRAQAYLKKYLGVWKGKEGPADVPAVKVAPSARRVFLVDRPGSAQVALFLGNMAVRQDNPDYFDLLVANQVLGGSISSRLAQDIRETKGYTYRIGSRLEHRLTSAIFRVRTPVRNEVLEPALEGVFEHLARLRSKAVTAEELEKAKSFLAGSFARSMETQEGVAEAVLRTQMHRLPPDFYDTYVQRVQAVTAAGVLRAANNFITPSEMVVVAVGDGAKIKDILAKFSPGPVVVLDQNGD
jgi:zinc protease